VSTNSENIHAGVSMLGEYNYLDEDDSEIGNIHEESPLTVLYQTLRWMPESAILAFLTFTATQKEFKLILDTIAMDKNWQDADGGQYRLDLLLPPRNSIVIPTVSLLFAILVGQTIVSFRGRTLCIDSSLNKESKDLEVLAQLVGSVGHQTQGDLVAVRIISSFVRKSNERLMKYISRIMNECRSYREKLISASSIYCEMNAMLDATIQLSGKAYEKQVNVNPVILSEIFSIIARLNDHRTERISALNVTCPLVHYVILCASASSIMGDFLIETDSSVLVGTILLIAKVIIDLESPSDEDYKVTSWSEFLVFRDRLKSTLKRN
jgi:hypothetical protein